MPLKNPNENIVIESTEEAITRGVNILRYEEGKINKRQVRKDVRSGTQTIDIRLLIAKADPEQKKILLEIAKKEGLDIDESA